MKKQKQKTATKPRRAYVDAAVITELALQKFGKHKPERTNGLWFFEQLLQAAENKEVELFTSSISVAECTHVDGNCDEEVQRFYRGLLGSGALIKQVQDSIFVVDSARDLRWKYEITLSGADSIHAASAIQAKCEELLTWDGFSEGDRAKLQLAPHRLKVGPPTKLISCPLYTGRLFLI